MAGERHRAVPEDDLQEATDGLACLMLPMRTEYVNISVGINVITMQHCNLKLIDASWLFKMPENDRECGNRHRLHGAICVTGLT